MKLRLILAAFVIARTAALLSAADGLAPDSLVRVTRGEMLMFEGKNFLLAPKGQEFTLLKHDGTQKRVFVTYLKDDGTLVALTLPDDAVEPSPPSASLDLHKGVQAFRDQRYDESKRLLLRAAQDKQFTAFASAISTRLDGALAAAAQARTGTPAGKQAFASAGPGLRDTAEQLDKAGLPSLALPFDEGVNRFGTEVPPSKLDRAGLVKRVTISQNSIMRSRQAIALKRLVEASKYIDEGLRAEPGHFELKTFQQRVQRDIADAESLYTTANKMRRFEAGVVHALSAIDDGLKLCSDHAALRALRKELSASFEERTSPRVTPAFLSAAKAKTSAQALEDGRRLYTNRCTECHDLEMLDSRSLASWERMVSGMSRRASLTAEEKARIMEYIAAAQSVVEASGSR